MNRASPEPPRRFARFFTNSGFGIAAVALATNLLLFAVILRFVSVGYETNDDPAMMMIVSGAGAGEPSEHLIFSNILIGRLLKRLFLSFDGVNWYTWYLVGTHFAAMSAVLYVFLRLQFSRLGFLAYALLFLGFEMRLLLLLQFTTTAAVAAVAGLLLLLSAESIDGRRFYISLAAGLLLLVLSSMIRLQAACLVIFLATPLLAYQLLVRRSKLSAVGLAVAGLFVLAALFVDRAALTNDEQWREFRAFNRVRWQINTYRLIDYTVETRPFFERELGWTENDTRMYLFWFFADTYHYSRHKLQKVVDHFGRRPASAGRSLNFLFEQIRVVPAYASLAVLNLLLGAVLSGPFRRRYLLVSLPIMLLVAGVFLYLASFSNLPPRVMLSALTFATAACFYLTLAARRETDFRKETGAGDLYGFRVYQSLFGMLSSVVEGPLTPKHPREYRGFRYPPRLRDLARHVAICGRAMVMVAWSIVDFVLLLPMILYTGVLYLGSKRPVVWCVLCALLAGYVSSIYLTSRELVASNGLNRQQQEDFEHLVEGLLKDFVDKDEGAVFVVPGSSLPYEWLPPFSDLKGLARIPIISLGWSTHSPHYQEMLERHSIDNLYRALYERPNLYIIGDSILAKPFETFVFEHFGERIAVREEQRYRFTDRQFPVWVMKPVRVTQTEP